VRGGWREGGGGGEREREEEREIEREREAGWIGRRKLHYFFLFSNSLSLRGMLIEMLL